MANQLQHQHQHHHHGHQSNREAPTMQSIDDSNMLSYMGGPGTENGDVGAMDDYQFMDALLDDGANFDEEPGNLGLSMMASPGTSTMHPATVSMGVSMPQHHQHQHVIHPGQSALQQLPRGGAGTGQNLGHSLGHQYQQAQIVPQQGQHESNTPSSLTARLNYPFTTPAAWKPKDSFPTATTGTAAPAQPPPEPKSEDISVSTTSSKKRSREIENQRVPEVQQGGGDQQRRRVDRNMREQERSHKITSQIANLKELLSAGNVPFKPDKHSTLVSVVDYIQQLQARSQLLDGEHKKLIETIAKTNELANSPYYPSDSRDEGEVTTSNLLSEPAGTSLEDEDAIFVRDLDYQNVFKQCSMPLAVASIDGRFLACNTEFEAMSGYDKELLLPGESDDDSSVRTQLRADFIPSDTAGQPSTLNTSQKKNLSLFNLLCREDMENVFLAMSRMLKQPASLAMQGPAVVVETDSSSGDGSNVDQPDYWSGDVSQPRNHESKIRINVTLVRNRNGRPKYFQCSLTSSVEETIDSGSSEIDDVPTQESISRNKTS